MRYTIIGVFFGVMAVLCGAIWMRFEDARVWRDADGKPNTSMLGSAFGSIGQGDIVSFDGVVGEAKSDGFVAIIAPTGHPPMLIGAINAINGAPELKEGDKVRIEARWYRKEVGDGPAHLIFVVTKRIGE